MEEPSIIKGDGIKLKRRFISFYILKLSIGKPYIKGDTMLKATCATKFSILHKKYPQSLAKTAIS
jgi:hypothetical protein